MMPFWGALRTRPAAQAATRGTNAAVVGMLGAALYNPVWTNAVQTQQDFALAGAASFYSPSGSCRPGSWSRCWPPPARFLVLCETSATTLGMGNATAPMMRSPFGRLTRPLGHGRAPARRRCQKGLSIGAWPWLERRLAFATLVEMGAGARSPPRPVCQSRSHLAPNQSVDVAYFT